MKRDLSDLIWCDLENDQERIEFLECDRAYETGIIAPVMVPEIIAAFRYRLEMQQALQWSMEHPKELHRLLKAFVAADEPLFEKPP